MKRKNKLRRKI